MQQVLTPSGRGGHHPAEPGLETIDQGGELARIDLLVVELEDRSRVHERMIRANVLNVNYIKQS